MNKILNFIQIDKNLATAGQPSKKQFKVVSKAGYEVVINLAMHNKGALKKEDKIVTKNGMIYYHIPITWKKPEMKRLKLFLAVLKMLQKQNKKVFIHCIMNYRASVFVYRYKKDVLKLKNVKLIAPKDYKPNKIWKKVLKNQL